MDILIKELESEGSRLIKKRKEVELVYKGMVNFETEGENPVKNLLSLKLLLYLCGLFF